MKLTFFACALVAVLIASQSHAQAAAPVASTTVAQIRSADVPSQLARLQGRIVAHQGGRRFVFSDGSGQLSAEIAPSRFPTDHIVTADQRVEVIGAVEREALGLRLDVLSLRVLR